MFETVLKNRNKHLLWLAAILVVMMPICLSIASNRSETVVKERNITADLRTRARAVATRYAMRAATSPFSPSLEMKENVDFLLTPALLMQEAISDDIVITYPSE